MQNFDILKLNKNNNGITFNIKVIPNSSVSNIIEITEEYIKMKLNSPPIENKANKEVVTLLSKLLKIPKSSINFLFGEKSKLKTIEINLTEEEFRQKLQNL